MHTATLLSHLFALKIKEGHLRMFTVTPQRQMDGPGSSLALMKHIREGISQLTLWLCSDGKKYSHSRLRGIPNTHLKWFFIHAPSLVQVVSF